MGDRREGAGGEEEEKRKNRISWRPDGKKKRDPRKDHRSSKGRTEVRRSKRGRGAFVDRQRENEG